MSDGRTATTPTSSLIECVRKVVRVHSGKDFEPDDFPTLEDGRAAVAALAKIEEALQAAYDLTDGFVMQRVGPRNYEAFYQVRTKLLEVSDG